MARKLIYNLRLIRENYTYAVYEIAKLYGISPDTVFRWISREGLKRIPGTKKYFVHSSDLRPFLEQKNARNKHPCAEGQIYCCKCHKPQKPVPASLKAKRMPNKTIRVSGRCEACNTRVNTFVSGKKWSECHPFHPDRNAPIEPP
ncbi:helix-turn-helix domain-containing protein [uncultured Sneathiella sp.]|uniref:helix-turn-helix domain-containing protein n=1 Tax=uncultured Sneathiella sp. TaxID=879315 RepID=UPI0025984197|nr:helix-turn-helix domain-containing protein [uncultured Sneathiella sp.]